MEISSLHYITTTPEAAERACQGGVRWVQLRVKNQPYAAWKQLALDTQAVARRYGATLLINDNPRLAQEIGADGAHLGAADMPPAEARALLGAKFIIGGTANTFADVQRLVAAGVRSPITLKHARSAKSCVQIRLRIYSNSIGRQTVCADISIK